MERPITPGGEQLGGLEGLSIEDLHDASRLTGLPWSYLLKHIIHTKYNNSGKQKKRIAVGRARRRSPLYRWWQKSVKFVKGSNKRHDPFPVMRRQCKNIEGRFGTGVLAFFTFQREMVLLNVAMMLIWIPVLAAGMFSDVWWDSFTKGKSLLDWVTTSWYAQTPLFYSGLPSASLIPFDSYPFVSQLYEIPLIGGAIKWVMDDLQGVPIGLLWALACIICFAISLVLIVAWLRTSLIQDSSGSIARNQRFPHCSLAFGSWKHSLRYASSVRKFRNQLLMAFREMCEARRVEKTVERRPFLVVLLDWMAHIAGLLTSVILIVLCGVAITLVVQVSTTTDLSAIKMLCSLAISIITNASPMIIRVVAELERWRSPGTRLALTLIRMWVCKMTALAVLIYQLFSQVRIELTGNVVDNLEAQCPTLDLSTQMAYQIIIDFVLTVVLALGPNLIPMILKKPKSPFVIGVNVVDVCYRQALIWMGSLLGPGNVILGALSNLFLFYAMYYITVWTNAPEQKAWAADRIDTYIFAVMLCTLFVSSVPLCLFLLWVGGNSNECGPFAEHGSGWKTLTYYTKTNLLYHVSFTWYDLFSALLNPVLLTPVLVGGVAIIYIWWGLHKKTKTELMSASTDLGDTRKQMSQMIKATKKLAEKKLNAAIENLKTANISAEDRHMLMKCFDSSVADKHSAEDMLVSKELATWVSRAKTGRVQMKDLTLTGLLTEKQRAKALNAARRTHSFERARPSIDGVHALARPSISTADVVGDLLLGRVSEKATPTLDRPEAIQAIPMRPLREDPESVDTDDEM